MMKSKIFIILVPILVLAMLLQVPFAFSASATDLDTLAAQTKFTFDVQKAAASDPGDIKVDLTVDGTDGELLSTIGATLVVDTNAFDLVDEDGNIVTDTYKADSTTLPLEFGIDYGALIDANAISIASYNATNEKMYIFVAGYLMVSPEQTGKVVSNNSYLATLYLKTKENVKPGADNLRVMSASEFRTDCPAGGVYSAGFGAAINDIFYIADSEVVFNLPQNGTIVLNDISTNDKPAMTNCVAVLKQGETEIQTAALEGTTITLNDVEPGTYTVILQDDGALSINIINITVVAGETTTLSGFVLMYGNANGDKVINARDVGVVLNNVGGDNVACDANGDGVINARDVGLVLSATHFNASEEQVTVDAAVI